MSEWTVGVLEDQGVVVLVSATCQRRNVRPARYYYNGDDTLYSLTGESLPGTREELELKCPDVWQEVQKQWQALKDSEKEKQETERPNEPLKALTRMSDVQVREELNELIATDGLDNERRVLLYMARRYFVLGANQYRALKLHDGRDSVEECMQEAGDCLFYTAKRVLESE